MEEERDQLSKEEKIQFLKRIVEGEDYFTDYLPVLNDFLDDEEAEVRKLALTGLWDYPTPEMIEVLFDKAENDPDEKVRCRAITTLGRYIYEGEMADYDFDWGSLKEIMCEDELPQEDFLQVKEFLLGFYRDQEKTLDERRFAVEALGFLTDPEVFEIIEEAYAHPDKKMKMSAIFAMGRSGNVRWEDAILDELHSPVKELQIEAIRAAGESGFEGAGRVLQRLTYSDDRDVKLESIWALGQTGWEGAFERLDELTYLGEDAEIREAAELALEDWFLYSGSLEGDYEEGDWEEFDEDEDWQDA
jgi:HEAT repeat protein